MNHGITSKLMFLLIRVCLKLLTSMYLKLPWVQWMDADVAGPVPSGLDTSTRQGGEACPHCLDSRCKTVVDCSYYYPLHLIDITLNIYGRPGRVMNQTIDGANACLSPMCARIDAQ